MQHDGAARRIGRERAKLRRTVSRRRRRRRRRPPRAARPSTPQPRRCRRPPRACRRARGRPAAARAAPCAAAAPQLGCAMRSWTDESFQLGQARSAIGAGAQRAADLGDGSRGARRRSLARTASTPTPKHAQITGSVAPIGSFEMRAVSRAPSVRRRRAAQPRPIAAARRPGRRTGSRRARRRRRPPRDRCRPSSCSASAASPASARCAKSCQTIGPWLVASRYSDPAGDRDARPPGSGRQRDGAVAGAGEAAQRQRDRRNGGRRRLRLGLAGIRIGVRRDQVADARAGGGLAAPMDRHEQRAAAAGRR